MNTSPPSLLEAAEKLAARHSTWADLSNALFDAKEGIIARAYPDRAERKTFMKSAEYQSIQALLESAIAQSGLVAGATPQKSGKFVVRVPRSLHAALEREAANENVSLNQLVVTKLAMQLSQLAGSQR